MICVARVQACNEFCGAHKAINRWCSQFSVKHGLAASVGIILGKAECCYVVDNSLVPSGGLCVSSEEVDRWSVGEMSLNNRHTDPSTVSLAVHACRGLMIYAPL